MGCGTGEGMSEFDAQLQVSFPGFALDVSLSLPGKGVSVLLGPSGSGKTTVLRALAGLERAHGRISFNGEVWQDDAVGRRAFVPTHRRPIGYVFQEASLFAHLSVRENLAYGQRRIPREQQRVVLEEAVDLLGIGHLLHRKPEGLSGGERQRVAIARALLTSPRVLLMDEPLSALDAARKAEILPFLERLNAQTGVPMVYVTHALEEAARLGDHLVLLEAGRVRASGPVADMFSRLDLPLSRLEEAAAVLDATVAMHDPAYGLSRLDVGTQAMWVGLTQASVGQRVKVRVMARDVSVALSHASDSSVLNILPAIIDGIRDDGGDTVTLVLRLVSSGGASGGMLLSRLTRRSHEGLKLASGQLVYAQIKGAALMG